MGVTGYERDFYADVRGCRRALERIATALEVLVIAQDADPLPPKDEEGSHV